MLMTSDFGFDYYYDKVMMTTFVEEVPLDILYQHSSKERWDYRLAAWLRDVGAAASTGKSLYEVVQAER